MAKKRATPKTADRHSSGFMVRLPEVYRAALDRLRGKTRRTYTVEVQIALDVHLKANGVTPPNP